jgi:hypothetical protein
MQNNAYRLLVEEPTYEVQYLVEEKNRNSPSNLFIHGPFLMANEANKNKRIYPLEEMVKEVDRYSKEMIAGKRSTGELNHPSCITSSASILCEDGWKNITEISETEKVYTLNPKTREIELHQITKKIDQEYKGKMYRVKGRNIDTLITPTHRLLLIDRYNNPVFVTIEEIFNNRTKYNKHQIPKRGNWFAETPEFFTLKAIKNVEKKGNYSIDPEVDSKIDYKTFVQFLGIWLAEGYTTSERKTTVGITQRKEEIKIKIRELLSRFPEEMKWSENVSSSGTSTFILRDLRLSTFLKENFGTDCYNKKIPKEFKNISAPLLEEMVYWFNLGDGRFSTVIQECGEYQIRNIFSTSKQLILDFNEILLKSGGCGNITELITEADYKFADRIIKAENKVPLYQLNIAKTEHIYLDDRFLKIEEVHDFDDRVYCVSVPNENFYCMDNGKCSWTGNSPEINLERICHMVTELKQNGNIFEGKSRILSTPMGQIVRSLILDGVKLGVSSRALGRLDSDGQYNKVSDFRLVAVDVVADPSVPTAFVNGILESKQWILTENGNFEPLFERFEKNIGNLPKNNKNQYLKEQVIAFINALKTL